jgi:Spy/CpxP family protein refolding chaperone
MSRRDRVKGAVRRTLAAAALVACHAALAQHASPYAADAGRDIKALSADEVRDYLDGKGMGLARAAELNGYPGPMHVLELADALRLTREQRERTEALFGDMRARAVAAGRAFVDAERDLDRLFRARAIDGDTLAAALSRVAERQADVRRIHLEAHLQQAAILSSEQSRRYAELRGYAGDPRPSAHEHRRH